MLWFKFLQRDDIEVLDEPLYAAFLKSTGVDRPYKDELLSKMECDGEKVVKDIIYGPGKKKYRFCKVILTSLSDIETSILFYTTLCLG
jgi:hypothetical protein